MESMKEADAVEVGPNMPELHQVKQHKPVKSDRELKTEMKELRERRQEEF